MFAVFSRFAGLAGFARFLPGFGIVGFIFIHSVSLIRRYKHGDLVLINQFNNIFTESEQQYPSYRNTS